MQRARGLHARAAAAPRGGLGEEELPPAKTETAVHGSKAASVNKNAETPSNPRREGVGEAEDDRALVARARAGEKEAFRALVERHQRRAFALALSLVRDENDARELVQDAFVRAYRSLEGFEGGSSFFTWLYRIITNLSIDLLRKPGRRAVELDEERLAAEDSEDMDLPFMSRYEGSDPALAVRRREIAERLHAALDELPSYHRAVIVLREVDGLSYEEMAQVLGISKGTVMSRLFHARQKLQRALADCYAEERGSPTAPAQGAKP